MKAHDEAKQTIMRTPEGLPILDGTTADVEALEKMLLGTTPIRFDWEDKWLKGEEYEHILRNLDSYVKAFELDKFQPKMHPECIYQKPISKQRRGLTPSADGLIYFVKGNTIGSDFGFPRLGIKKRFKW